MSAVTYQIYGTDGAALRGREGYVYRSAAWVAKHRRWLDRMGFRAVMLA